MVVIRLRLPLEEAEYSALLKASQIDLRNPSDQARMLLRIELERRGYLAMAKPTVQPIDNTGSK